MGPIEIPVQYILTCHAKWKKVNIDAGETCIEYKYVSYALIVSLSRVQARVDGLVLLVIN